MATLLENQMPNMISAKEAETLHNSQISENYRILRDVVDLQFEDIERERARIRASANVLERGCESVSSVEIPRERVGSGLFTPETLDRAIRNNVTTEPVMETVAASQAFVAERVESEEVASLSNFAKAVATAFAAVVVMMLTVICINTQIINQKANQLATLEQKRQELVAEDADLQEKILRKTSKKAIEEFAEKHGMVKDN